MCEEFITVALSEEEGAVGCTDIPLIDDNIYESVEDFRVQLLPDSNVPAIQLGAITIATVLIDDLGKLCLHILIVFLFCRVIQFYYFVSLFLGPEVPSVNDTVVGDPLLTVPLDIDSLPEDIDLTSNIPPSLCMEIHGEQDKDFNLLSDSCVSVNAHYVQIKSGFNVMDEIGVRAIDQNGLCHNIAVHIDSCSATVDGEQVIGNYRSAGIFVRNNYARHVRVSVPNCNGTSHLVMYIICQKDMLVEDPYGGPKFTASMIKFVIARGINLSPGSHGLLGKFYLPLCLGSECNYVVETFQGLLSS